jgi:hypothetical protein
MASSDDFKAQLKAGNITEAIALALSEAVELKFTTWVPSEEDVEASEAKPGHRLRTRINMIEGEVEHEVGEEFIGNGRYRELKQFHLEQVAQGSQLIENNLKSLQKLFEVLVALHYPDAKTPVIDPESLDASSQLLLPVEEVADARLVVEPQEAVVADVLVTPDLGTEEDVPDAGLVAQPQETAMVDALVTPDLVTEGNIPQEPSPASELPASSLTVPTEHDQVLEEEADEEDEDDWDNSVLDLLESLPVAPPPTPDTSESDLRETLEWHDLVEEESESDRTALDSPENRDWENFTREDGESPPSLEPQNLDTSSSQVDEDLRDLVEEQSEPQRRESNLLETQDWENLRREDFESSSALEAQTLDTSSFQVDQDWGDLVEDEPEFKPKESDSLAHQDWENLRREDFESPPASGEQHLEASSSQVDEDWGDLVEDEPDTELEKPIPNLESLDLDEDEEWDDWVLEEPEPLSGAPVVDMDSLDLGEDEDWGDLVDDSDPFAAAPSLDKSASDLESAEDWDEFTSDELELSAAPFGIESDTDGVFDLSGVRDDVTPTDSESSTDPGSLEKMPLSGDSALPQQSELGVSDEHSDTLAGSEADKDTKPKSAGKRMPPPPPPPSRSPNQNK